MKNNKTDATNVLKFFREAKEARQGGQNNLDMMSYGGTDDPPKDPPKETNHLGTLDSNSKNGFDKFGYPNFHNKPQKKSTMKKLSEYRFNKNN